MAGQRTKGLLGVIGGSGFRREGLLHDLVTSRATPFRGLTYDREIAAKAREISIAPGVAVHQMHRRRLLDYKFGNRLCIDLTGTSTE